MTIKPLTPLDDAIDGCLRCVICGAGMGKCDCWTPCSCGWTYRKGTKCRNPSHAADVIANRLKGE